MDEAQKEHVNNKESSKNPSVDIWKISACKSETFILLVQCQIDAWLASYNKRQPKLGPLSWKQKSMVLKIHSLELEMLLPGPDDT